MQDAVERTGMIKRYKPKVGKEIEKKNFTLNYGD